MRTLESIYWYGTKLLNTDKNIPFIIDKLDPYQDYSYFPTKQEAVEAVIRIMKKEGKNEMVGDWFSMGDHAGRA